MTQIFYPWTGTTPFVTNVYDSLSRVATQTNVLGATWSYFLAGARSEEVDPYGTRHVLYNNPHGKTVTDLQNCCSSGSQVLSTSAWDALDRLTLATAPEGNTVGYTYDLLSNVLTVTKTPKPGSSLSPLVTTTTYDPTFNKPLTVTDPRGLVSTMTYDPATGNLVSMTADSGAGHYNATTRYTYNGFGLPLTVTDPLGVVTQNAYDGANNRTSVVRDPGSGGHVNQTTTATYNARGDPLTVTDANGHTTTNTYDSARRVLTTSAPGAVTGAPGTVTAYTYDTAGRVTQTQQSLLATILRTTSATYTLSGKVATATDANNHTTTYAYDLLDRLTTTTDAASRVTQYGYDVFSRRTSVRNPAFANPLAQQSFTLNGLRASLTDANLNVTGFAYDGFDRLATTTYPDSSTELLAYDPDGNVTARTTRAGQTIAYTWDTLNRLSTKTPPSPAPVVTYSYDLAGRRTGVSDTSASIQPIATPTSGQFFSTAYTYDALNRQIGATTSPVAGAGTRPTISPVAFSHSYNAVNQRTGQSVTDPGSNVWIGYPTGTSTTATSYTANFLNQYTAVGSASPTYDGNGNLTADGTYTFGHDAENRLISATKTGMTASYAFDGRGRRKLKTVNGTTTITVTDADNREVLDYDGSSGTILRWYSYGQGPNALLHQMDMGAGTRASVIPDMLGSVIGTIDAASGTVTAFSYRPYGSSSSPPPQFAYTGQRIDTETGLYYSRARHLSPAWGRFWQVDPIGHRGGMHLYAYVENDPLNLLDPMGLETQSSWWSSAINLLGDSAGRTLELQQQQTQTEMAFAGGPTNYAALQFVPFVAVGGMATLAALPIGGIAATEAIQNGALIERTYTIGETTIGVLGEASVSGTELTVGSLAVYPMNSAPVSIGTRAVMSMFNSFAAEVEAMGFTRLTVSGLGYSGANPGRTATITRALGGPP